MTAQSAQHQLTSAPAQDSRFDTAIEVLLTALLAFAPFAFGAVEAWSELVVFATTAAILLCLVLKSILRPDFQFRRTVAFVPIVLFLVLACVQLVPMPAAVVSFLSPRAHELRKQLLGDWISASHTLDSMTLSLYPLPTRHDLRLVLIATAIFIVVLNVYRTRRRIARLLLAIACIGAGVALLEIAQVLSKSHAIYWRVPVDGVANAGPFVSHTNYGQFMNLSIGATLGLLVLRMYSRRDQSEGHGQRAWRIDAALIAMLVIDGVSMILSRTRGGTITMLGSALVMGVLFLWWRGRAKAALITFVVVVVAAALAYPWLNEVVQKMATTKSAAVDRLGTVKACIAACRQFPLFGTGLGTHEFVFPMFDRTFDLGLSTFAENEYAQVAEEMGIPGLLVAFLFVGIIATAFIRILRRRRDAKALHSVAFGLGFGLLAVAVHSFWDFGQHLPAIFCLSAAFCALILNLSRFEEPNIQDHSTAPVQSHGRTAVRAIALLIVCIVALWAMVETNTARRAESLWAHVLHQESLFRQRDWQGSPDSFQHLIAGAEQVVAIQPENITYRHWLNVYRWRALSASSHREASTHKVVVNESTLDRTRVIVADFQEGLWHCPTFGPSWTFMGQLEFNILRLPQGANHILTGYRLNSCDVNACLVAGDMAVKKGDWKLAVEAYRHAAIASPWEILQAVPYLVDRAHRPDLLVEAASGNIDSLCHIVPPLLESSQNAPYAKAAREQAIRLLEGEARRTPAYAEYYPYSRHMAQLAEFYLQDRRYDDAARMYERALSLRVPAGEWLYPYWHVLYAQALIPLNRDEEARRELKLALNAHPDWIEAQKLLAMVEAKTNARH